MLQGNVSGITDARGACSARAASHRRRTCRPARARRRASASQCHEADDWEGEDAASLESLIRDIVAGKVKHKGKLELSPAEIAEHRRVLGPGPEVAARNASYCMRTLCLLLILANVLYFMWSQMIDVQVSSLERKGAKPVEPPARIVLAREMIEANPEERSVGQIRDVQPPAVEPLARADPRGAGDADSAARHAVVHEHRTVRGSAAGFAGASSVARRRLRAAPAHGAGRDLGGLLGQRAGTRNARCRRGGAQDARQPTASPTFT